ncbi:MAG: MarR family transcriptional regulator [SAR202 cluster bacterium]|nr:MarR family transcriptional regulator [SAR202 cluster bacterium]
MLAEKERGAPGTTEVKQLLQVLSVGQAVYERFDALSRRHGMTLAQAAVLLAVKEQDGAVTVSVLAKQLRRQSHTLTELVDALQKNGLVDRRRDQVDRRKVWISLTPSGLQRLDQYLAASVGGLSTFSPSGEPLASALEVARRSLSNILDARLGR